MKKVNRELQKKLNVVALILSDFKKFTYAYLYYCQGIELSHVAKFFNESTSKLKRTLSKFETSYDLNYMCNEVDVSKITRVLESFKEVNGRYKCLLCKRYVTRRGRVQHLITVHRNELKELI